MQHVKPNAFLNWAFSNHAYVVIVPLGVLTSLVFVLVLGFDRYDYHQIPSGLVNCAANDVGQKGYAITLICKDATLLRRDEVYAAGYEGLISLYKQEPRTLPNDFEDLKAAKTGLLQSKANRLSTCTTPHCVKQGMENAIAQVDSLYFDATLLFFHLQDESLKQEYAQIEEKLQTLRDDPNSSWSLPNYDIFSKEYLVPNSQWHHQIGKCLTIECVKKLHQKAIKDIQHVEENRYLD